MKNLRTLIGIILLVSLSYAQYFTDFSNPCNKGNSALSDGTLCFAEMLIALVEIDGKMLSQKLAGISINYPFLKRRRVEFHRVLCLNRYSYQDGGNIVYMRKNAPLHSLVRKLPFCLPIIAWSSMPAGGNLIIKTLLWCMQGLIRKGKVHNILLI